MEETLRRFTIADGMIPVAATAASMVDPRWLLTGPTLILPQP